MSASDGYAVPPALRSARFVPRQAPGRREPARVTAGAFRAAGLPVPEHPAQLNVYQLSGRRGLPWSPAIDAHIGRRGGEVLGVVAIDCDTQLAVDHSVWLDGFRWLADAGAAIGQVLDTTLFLTVRTPGDPDRGHAPGWHLLCRAHPDCPVRYGPLKRCAAVEIKNRLTCPGSPGYEIRSAPAELPVLPRWIAELAGPPVVRPPRNVGKPGAFSTWNRLHGVITCLLDAEQGQRNQMLFWASLRAGEMVADGSLDESAVTAALQEAAADLGLVREDGEQAVLATIRSGLERSGVTYEPAR